MHRHDPNPALAGHDQEQQWLANFKELTRALEHLQATCPPELGSTFASRVSVAVIAMRDGILGNELERITRELRQLQATCPPELKDAVLPRLGIAVRVPGPGDDPRAYWLERLRLAEKLITRESNVVGIHTQEFAEQYKLTVVLCRDKES